MAGPITDALIEDHHRIGAWLERSLNGDPDSYVAFRGALLRHIGIEEKIIVPALRAQGIDLALTAQLRLDHAALAAMLVPSPTAEILGELKALLALHDPLEEGPEGLYPHADGSLRDVDDLLARIGRAPIPTLAAHFDGPRAFAGIDRLLARAREGRGRFQSAPQTAHVSSKP